MNPTDHGGGSNSTNSDPVVESTEETVTHENGKVVTTKTIYITNSRKIDGINTVQRLYSSTSDDSDINFITNSSNRRSLNKDAYLRLHRNVSNRKSIELLKGKYETTEQPTDKEIDKKETDVNKNKIENGNYSLDENVDVIQKTTNNIENLQSKLSPILNRAAVESLKFKYSPSNFGYTDVNLVKEKPEIPTKPTSRIPTLSPKPSLSEKPFSYKSTLSHRLSLPDKPKLPDKPRSLDKRSFSDKPALPAKPAQLDKPLTRSTEKPTLREKPVVQNKHTPPKPAARTSILSNASNRSSRISYEFDTKLGHEVILRSSSEDSIEKLESFMSEFTMDPKREVKEVKEKKRTSSFRKILTGGLFSKDKKKNEKKGDGDKNRTKKTENVIVADNMQNEQTFTRNSAQRHTIDNHYSKQPKKSSPEFNTKKQYIDTTTNNLNDIERRYAEMHINQFNKIKATFSNADNCNNHTSETYQYLHQQDNVASPIDKYIDTSSSSNTLESIDRNTYQNALIAQAELKQLREREIRNRQQKENGKQTDPLQIHDTRFDTPPRAKETYQKVQLVKPKALIPINSERALPNPYHNVQDDKQAENKKPVEKNFDIDEKDFAIKSPIYNRQNDFNDNYGYSTKSSDNHRQYSPNLTKSSTSSSNQNSPSSPSFSTRSSPRSPTLEGTKLRLPSNREKVNLQPRIKSPIPQPKVSTEKLIATELLKSKPESKKTDKSQSPLQKLDNNYIDGIYETKPVNNQNINQSPVHISVSKPPEIASATDAFEAAKWHQKQRELSNSPALNESPQVIADVMVHADPEFKRNSLQYGSLPVTMRKPNNEVVNMRQRSVTPVRRVPSTASLQQSPQKHEIRQSVELYCWKEIQKLKEKQDQELKYQLQFTPYGYVEDPIIQRRSRSVEPNQQRNGKRSTSLPREVKGNVPPRNYHREAIPENRPIMYREEDIYAQKNPNFIRRSPQRRTISGTAQRPGPLYESYYSNSAEVPYRPIFNRGSLNPQAQVEAQSQLQKKVSFNGNRSVAQQSWPTRNGYVQSPPQRRLEKTMSIGDDEVFLRDSQIKQMNEQIQQQMLNRQYSNRDSGSVVSIPRNQNMEESPYGTRTNQIYVQNNRIYAMRPPQEQVINEPMYISRQNKQNSNELSKQKQENLQNIYGTREQPDIDPLYVRQRQIRPLQQPQDVRDSSSVINEPVYGSRQQIMGEKYYGNNNTVAESPYGSRRMLNTNPNVTKITKQVTITNKVCDIYGNIHETGKQVPVSPTNPAQIQQTGVIYGQLQGNVLGRPPQYQSYNQISTNFVRGTRLTASANDMYKRYPNDPRYREIVYEEGPYGQHDRNFNPNAPLPPTPNEGKVQFMMMRRGNTNRAYPQISDTESDTSEVTKIMNRNYMGEEEWNSDGKSGRGIPGSESGSTRGENDLEIRGRSRNTRRDDPRRHTLAGDQQYGMAGQGGPLSRTMDLEGQPRGYPPLTNPMLFDDDPGIMSEVETSSTGFRRGGKQRSSLPVVRTPSKTLERPLGLVFLQYRNETKRALLPNEITSIDTVKALFVRSFPKQLTMEYLDSPQVKIYIHDSSKDMFYELEDLRSHLREIRDRSVLRLFESADVSGGLPMAGIGIAGGVGHFEDPSYFSEPEFDSEYQHQHIHKSKGSASKSAPYYMGSTASLPRSGLLRAYSPAVTAIPPERLKTLPTDGYMSSPERGSRYEDPYYSQYTTRSGSITPVIDEEVSDTELLDESYSLYGVKLATGAPRAAPRTGFPPATAVPYDTTRIRVENMERQLANLTGLVQKALTQTPANLQVPGGRDNYRTDKSVSFEKSVSFSDEPPDMNSPKQHSPQHTGNSLVR